VKTELLCKSGVIHVVDRVMMPATKDVVATSVDVGKFLIPAKALNAAGLSPLRTSRLPPANLLKPCPHTRKPRH
jgi:hypothetical protein